MFTKTIPVATIDSEMTAQEQLPVSNENLP